MEYANAYSEVLEILNHIPKADYNKVPNNMIELFATNKNKEYSFSYDVNKTLNEQNVSKKAKTIIAILFRDYWATPYQRERILEKEKYDIAKMEEEKREKYNPDNIFKNNKNDVTTAIDETEDTSISMQIVEYKEPIFKRIMNKILEILHINKRKK